MVDVQQIDRVLANLLDNVLKYTPPGGTAQMRASAGMGGVLVETCDTGEGIVSEDPAHDCQCFYRSE
jgi:K+-sensing histidine kinase KdpD